MGQPISVIEKTSSVPGVLRYETNRSLTGMGKEIYRSPDDVVNDRPPDVLAERLFKAGGVAEVSVYGGVVTLRADGDPATYKAIIESLYAFYQPGDPYPEAPTAPEG